MKRIFKWLTIVLALCLPWHGAITVFLPEFFRYWKEIILFLFFAGFCWKFIVSRIKYKRALFNFKLSEIKKDILFGVLFLIYGLILVLFSADKISALMSLRYLGIGVFIYLLFSIFHQNPAKFCRNFSLPFILSSILSVVFGIWVKFGNGAEVLKNYYSQTISSWVPGQTIPLWHEAGEFVRMQGTSSGPIEFSHLLVVSLSLTLTSKIKNIYKILFSFIFLFGIYQSYSRAAILAAIIILVFFFLSQINFSFQKNKKSILVSLVLIFFAGFCVISQTNVLSRAGTSDHITRPVEAFQFGLDNILSNNLGKVGPVARAVNLRENNDDSAMIAENVFVDIFAQMGVVGIVLYVLFFFYIGINLQPKFRGFFLAALLVMNLATIFDMTPVAISFFVIFFCGRKTS